MKRCTVEHLTFTS